MANFYFTKDDVQGIYESSQTEFDTLISEFRSYYTNREVSGMTFMDRNTRTSKALTPIIVGLTDVTNSHLLGGLIGFKHIQPDEPVSKKRYYSKYITSRSEETSKGAPVATRTLRYGEFSFDVFHVSDAMKIDGEVLMASQSQQGSENGAVANCKLEVALKIKQVADGLTMKRVTLAIEGIYRTKATNDLTACTDYETNYTPQGKRTIDIIKEHAGQLFWINKNDKNLSAIDRKRYLIQKYSGGQFDVYLTAEILREIIVNRQQFKEYCVTGPGKSGIDSEYDKAVTAGLNPLSRAYTLPFEFLDSMRDEQGRIEKNLLIQNYFFGEKTYISYEDWKDKVGSNPGSFTPLMESWQEPDAQNNNEMIQYEPSTLVLNSPLFDKENGKPVHIDQNDHPEVDNYFAGDKFRDSAFHIFDRVSRRILPTKYFGQTSDHFFNMEKLGMFAKIAATKFGDISAFNDMIDLMELSEKETGFAYAYWSLYAQYLTKQYEMAPNKVMTYDRPEIAQSGVGNIEEWPKNEYGGLHIPEYFSQLFGGRQLDGLRVPPEVTEFIKNHEKGFKNANRRYPPCILDYKTVKTFASYNGSKYHENYTSIFPGRIGKYDFLQVCDRFVKHFEPFIDVLSQCFECPMTDPKACPSNITDHTDKYTAFFANFLVGNKLDLYIGHMDKGNATLNAKVLSGKNTAFDLTGFSDSNTGIVFYAIDNITAASNVINCLGVLESKDTTPKTYSTYIGQQLFGLAGIKNDGGYANGEDFLKKMGSVDITGDASGNNKKAIKGLIDAKKIIKYTGTEKKLVNNLLNINTIMVAFRTWCDALISLPAQPFGSITFENENDWYPDSSTTPYDTSKSVTIEKFADALDKGFGTFMGLMYVLKTINVETSEQFLEEKLKQTATNLGIKDTEFVSKTLTAFRNSRDMILHIEKNTSGTSTTPTEMLLPEKFLRTNMKVGFTFVREMVEAYRSLGVTNRAITFGSFELDANRQPTNNIVTDIGGVLAYSKGIDLVAGFAKEDNGAFKPNNIMVATVGDPHDSSVWLTYDQLVQLVERSSNAQYFSIFTEPLKGIISEVTFPETIVNKDYNGTTKWTRMSTEYNANLPKNMTMALADKNLKKWQRATICHYMMSKTRRSSLEEVAKHELPVTCLFRIVKFNPYIWCETIDIIALKRKESIQLENMDSVRMEFSTQDEQLVARVNHWIGVLYNPTCIALIRNMVALRCNGGNDKNYPVLDPESFPRSVHDVTDPRYGNSFGQYIVHFESVNALDEMGVTCASGVIEQLRDTAEDNIHKYNRYTTYALMKYLGWKKSSVSNFVFDKHEETNSLMFQGHQQFWNPSMGVWNSTSAKGRPAPCTPRMYADLNAGTCSLNITHV